MFGIKLDEKIMLGLRLKEGIDIKELFNNKNGIRKKLKLTIKNY